MKLNQEQIKKGFRFENSRLEKYTKDGRKRKNWKNTYRGKSQQFIKEKCEKCGSTENLTIHHIIPLRKKIIITKANCETLCETCHKKVHFILKKVGSRRYKTKKKKQIKKKKFKQHPSKEEEIGILMLEKGLWGGYRIID